MRRQGGRSPGQKRPRTGKRDRRATGAACRKIASREKEGGREGDREFTRNYSISKFGYGRGERRCEFWEYGRRGYGLACSLHSRCLRIQSGSSGPSGGGGGDRDSVSGTHLCFKTLSRVSVARCHVSRVSPSVMPKIRRGFTAVTLVPSAVFFPKITALGSVRDHGVENRHFERYIRARVTDHFKIFCLTNTHNTRLQSSLTPLHTVLATVRALPCNLVLYPCQPTTS